MNRMLVGACVAASLLGAFPAPAKDVTCVCVYYPHWHKYDKGMEWFSPKWDWSQGEWAFVKDAKPRFPGHKQPMRPYAGFPDESDPTDMAKDIALAANAGIGVFLYDYYWYDGKVTQEDALEKGFLGTPNRDRMKFALMWCYHERNDQFRPELGKERRRLMSLAHTPEEFQGLIAHSVKRYFPRPEYWRLDGKLFFSIYNAPYFVSKHGGDPAKIRAELDAARAQVRAAGLGEVHFNAQNPRTVGEIALLKACGFDSVTDYNHNTAILPPQEACALRQKGQWEVDYALALPPSRARWAEMAKGVLPYFPQVTTGWDSTPRCKPSEPYPWRKNEYPYTMTFRNNTPDLFREQLAAAKAFAEADAQNPGVVYVNGWNEYTEGTYLVPNNFDSDGFLRAVADVFGRHPADEYTYVNPSTKVLYTIPAPDKADVAYGSHPKQKIDLFLPKGKKGPYPVFMYIHGGGWNAGAMEDHILASSVRHILDQGIAVVGTGYRYIREARVDNPAFPVLGCLDDCENALKFVKAHAAEWNLDVSRIGLAGGSAGACTALYLALKDDNALGITALAPVIPQTSMDPRETKDWIPDATYGGHAFGYRNFAEWLAHRDARLADIERISPAALLRKIDPKKAPHIVLQAGVPPKPGTLAKDPTHSPVFCVKFKEIADARGIPCDFIAGGGKPVFGDALQRVADILSGVGAAYIPDPVPVQTKDGIEVTAVYYPGTDWMSEWDMVDQVFPHIKPTLGWYDEGHPENIDWQIKWALEHGVTSFLVDWYWCKGVQRLDHWVKAYPKAKFAKRLKWYMNWCNHNEPGAHGVADQIAVTKWWIDHYFKEDFYYKDAQGRPLVVIWEWTNLDRDFRAIAEQNGEKRLPLGEGLKRALDISRKLAKEAGFPGIQFTCFANGGRPKPEQMKALRHAGIEALFQYNFAWPGQIRDGLPPGRVKEFTASPNWCKTPWHYDFAWSREGSYGWWRKNWDKDDIPFWPTLATGWNSSPRDFGVANYVTNRTVAEFRLVCEEAKRFCADTGCRRVVIGPMNEWQEGSYIEPNAEYGFALYDQVRDVFCEKPAAGWPKNLTPQDIGRPNPQFPPMPFYDRTSWDFDDGHQGWYRNPYGTQTIWPHDGEIEFFRTCAQRTPVAIRTRPKPFEAAKFTSFKVKMRLKPNLLRGEKFKPKGDEVVRLMWGRVGHAILRKDAARPVVEADISAQASAKAVPDGQWHVYTLPLADNPNWNGIVDELWFDPSDLAFVNAEIDWMRFE